MTTKELIQQYVTAHADNRWMDASELETLLTEFAEKLKAKQVATIKCEKKSPITGGEMQLMQEKSSVKFRGEEISFIKKFYHCVNSGQEFTDTELDNDNMWTIFRAYWERKGFEHFYDIDGYREEQEPISDDLEQAAEQTEQREGNLINGRFKAGFKSGAQWQKAEMMAKAIRGQVSVNVKSNYHSLIYGCWDMDNALKNCNDGDKVKIIIVKE